MGSGSGLGLGLGVRIRVRVRFEFGLGFALALNLTLALHPNPNLAGKGPLEAADERVTNSRLLRIARPPLGRIKGWGWGQR